MGKSKKLDIQEVEIQGEESQEEVVENVFQIDPEKTFCEQTTYLEFLLSNAKDEEEAEHIKATISDYLDIYNDHDIEDDDEEITEDE